MPAEENKRSLKKKSPSEIVRRIRRTLSGTTKYEWYLRATARADEPESKRRERARAFSYGPKISLIVPVYDTDERWLRRCIGSVLNQDYDNWELCIADGGSSRPHVRSILEEHASRDRRIKVRFLEGNRGIAGNSNAALDSAAGDYVGFLDHDDELTQDALYEIVRLLNGDPRPDFIYSDEDKITTGGKRFAPHFKSDWAPDSFRSYNYICHFTVIRTTIVREIGGFREGYDGSQDYDLFLRAAEKTDRIAHIPKVLYHWRAVRSSAASDRKAKMYAYESAKRALRDHLRRMNLKAEVCDGPLPGSYRIKYSVDRSAKVAVVVSTRDNVKRLARCLESIRSHSSHDDCLIYVVDAQSRKPETLEYYDGIGRQLGIEVVPYAGGFNRSAMNNYCASLLESDYVVFINDNVSAASRGWLEAMLEFAQRDDVGAVGPLLCYTNDTVQHAGVIVGLMGTIGHSHRKLKRRSSGYFGRRKVIQNLSAVGGACLMTRTEVLRRLNGFDESFSGPLTAVDFCLRARREGYLMVFTPYAEMVYHGSRRRRPAEDDDYVDSATLASETERFRSRWAEFLAGGDPYYNPNLTTRKEDFSIRSY